MIHLRFYFKLTQLLACFVIFLFAITPNKLQGRLFYNGTEQIMCLMESRGGPCQQITLYRTSRPMKMATSGFSSLFSGDDEGQQQDNTADGSKRILAILDASKLSKDSSSNATDEMKLRALLLYEWKSAQGHSDDDPINANGITEKAEPSLGPNLDVATAVNISNETVAALNVNATAAEDIWTMDTVIFIPTGVSAYRISIWNTRTSKSMYDQFGYFADALWHIFIYNACAMVFMEVSLLVLAYQYKTNQFESIYATTIHLMAALGSFIFCGFLCAINIDWNALWQCTNFRPEFPIIFSVNSFLSTVLLMCLTAEVMYCTCELWLLYAEEEDITKKLNSSKVTANNTRTSSAPGPGSSSHSPAATNLTEQQQHADGNGNNNNNSRDQQRASAASDETFYITVHMPPPGLSRVQL